MATLRIRNVSEALTERIGCALQHMDGAWRRKYAGF